MFNNINKFNYFKYCIPPLLFIGVFLIRYLYSRYCNKITFERLDKFFPRKNRWERELGIYSISLSNFYTHNKKQKCFLLISGFRDIPFLWDELNKYFKKEKWDYYAPRTFGTGRSFFQECDPKDWIITYLEAIFILQEQYHEIDIIAFSAGCSIALYLSQFKFKCKINNLILIAPFLLKKKTFIDNIIEGPLSFLMKPIIKFFLPYRLKFIEQGFKYPRDIYYEPNAKHDFYELVGFINMELKLMSFKNIRPRQIFANDIFILFPNKDKVIGDIFKQQQIIMDIFNRLVPIIFIPSSEYRDEFNQIINCSHVVLKEHPIIINEIFETIKNIVNKNKEYIYSKYFNDLINIKNII